MQIKEVHQPGKKNLYIKKKNDQQTKGEKVQNGRKDLQMMHLTND